MNFTEHFGIHFTNPRFLPPATIYSWKNNGVPFHYPLPSVTLTSAPNGTGGVTVTPTVANNTNQSLIVQFRATMTLPIDPVGVQLEDLVDTNSEIEALEAEPEPGDNGLMGALLEPGQVLGVDGEGHDPTDPIILDPNAWLLANPGVPGAGFDVDLNNEGESALTTLRVFAVGPNNTRGDNVANIFSAVNTVAVPEPSSVVLLGLGIFAFLAFRLRRV